MPPCNTRATTAHEMGLVLEERVITLTVSADLAAYLRTIAEGAGQSIDDVVSERLEEFKRLWGSFTQ